MKIIAGEQVYLDQQARKISTLGDHKFFPSEPLCAWQSLERSRGYCAAEIVESRYGYSLRHASGLDNWGLIASSRRGDLDGTLADAERAAIRWCALDPSHRYAYIRD
jgi:hypothetical protein